MEKLGVGCPWSPWPRAGEVKSDATQGLPAGRVWQQLSGVTRGRVGESRMSSKRSRVEVSRATGLGPGLRWGASTGASAHATPRKGDGGGGGGLRSGGLWAGAF